MDYCTGQMMNGKASKRMAAFTKSQIRFPGRSDKKLYVKSVNNWSVCVIKPGLNVFIFDSLSKNEYMKANYRKDTRIIKAIFSAYAPVKTVSKKSFLPYPTFVRSFFNFGKQA
jgi:hypothetical protein